MKLCVISFFLFFRVLSSNVCLSSILPRPAPLRGWVKLGQILHPSGFDNQWDLNFNLNLSHVPHRIDWPLRVVSTGDRQCLCGQRSAPARHTHMLLRPPSPTSAWKRPTPVLMRYSRIHCRREMIPLMPAANHASVDRSSGWT